MNEREQHYSVHVLSSLLIGPTPTKCRYLAILSCYTMLSGFYPNPAGHPGVTAPHFAPSATAPRMPFAIQELLGLTGTPSHTSPTYPRPGGPEAATPTSALGAYYAAAPALPASMSTGCMGNASGFAGAMAGLGGMAASGGGGCGGGGNTAGSCGFDAAQIAARQHFFAAAASGSLDASSAAAVMGFGSTPRNPMSHHPTSLDFNGGK